MKTQISRDNYNAKKRYSGVYQQQGRMITDSDWNELVETLKSRLEDVLKDIVGNGSPRTRRVEIITGPKIKEGYVYAEGLCGKAVPKASAVLGGDGSFALNDQADLEYPTAPAIAKGTLYADLWERSVTSLEDLDLRDAGLNGADTCSRKQVMTQVKWAPDGKNFADTEINPARGSAPLYLELRQSTIAPDPCDPCAEFMELDQLIGNYLFRVEVHSVTGAANNPTELILKWSSENGAIQYSLEDSLPDTFKTGAWIYEFFNDMCEKHPGVHLMTNPPVKKGTLLETCDTTTAPADSKYVRRWDGFCKLVKSGTNWTLAASNSGKDLGVTLSTSIDSNAPGYVQIGSEITINLNRIKLNLSLAGEKFVAGDYWLAPVRQNLPGDPGGSQPVVILDHALPVGITHHYVKLADVEAGGVNIRPFTDQENRQHHFPPLTDLMAADIGIVNTCTKLYDDAANLQQALDNLCSISAEDIAFTDNCDKLFDGAANLQQALDNLCSINAEDIAFTDNCANLFDGAANLQQALNNLCSINAGDIAFTDNCDKLFDGAVNLQQALDNLCSINAGDIAFTDSCAKLFAGATNLQQALNNLCSISAADIGYSSAGACSELSGAVTVKQAIDTLCELKRKGGGCSVTVGKDGDFATLQEAFDKLKAEPYIVICLLPGKDGGVHYLDGSTGISDKQFVKINGNHQKLEIREPVKISFDAEKIVLSDLLVVVTNEKSSLVLAGSQVFVERCNFQRTQFGKDTPPLLQFKKINSKNPASIHLAGNVLQTSEYVNQLNFDPDIFLPAETSAIPDIIPDKLTGIFKIDRVANKFEYEDARSQFIAAISAMTPARRKKWAESRKVAAIEKTKPVVNKVITAFFNEITQNKVREAALSELLDNLVTVLAELVYYQAIGLEKGVAGIIEKNVIRGYVTLYENEAVILNWENQKNQKLHFAWALQYRNQYLVFGKPSLLTFQDNYLVQVHHRVNQAIQDLIQVMPGAEPGNAEPFETPPADGYEQINIIDNRFEENGSSFAGSHVWVNGNTFLEPGENMAAAFILANSCILAGNKADQLLKGPYIDTVVPGDAIEKAANLIRID